MDDDDFTAESLARVRTGKLSKTKENTEQSPSDDPEIQAIIEETDRVKRNSLASTQNSLKSMREAIEVADKSSLCLKQQGEQLGRIEKKADDSNLLAEDGYRSAKEMHRYKGLIPVSIKNLFTGSKKKRKDEELAKLHKNIFKENDRICKVVESVEAAISESNTIPKLSFAEEGDDLETQINCNLEEISSGLKHLHMQAINMNLEIQRHVLSINKTESTLEHSDYTIGSARRKLQEFS